MASKYWEQQDQATRDRMMQRGDQLAGQLDSAQGGYQNLEGKYNSDVDSALSDLQGTPGYTDQEAQAIQGQGGLDALGNVDYNSNFLSGDEQSQISGDPYQAYRSFNPGSTEDTVHSNESNYAQATALNKGALNDTTRQGQLGVTGAVDRNASALTDDKQYSQDVDNVLNTTADRTYGAIDPGKLGLSQDYQQGYNFTPQDQQDLVTQAGRTVGNANQASNDAVERQAIADGNTSPAALAAIKERNNINAGAEAGDAMTDARIKAKQEALGVTQQKEQTRLGTEQDISGRGMTAAQDLGQLANTATQQRQASELGAREYLTGAQLDAAKTSANMGTSTAEFNTNQDAAQEQYSGNQALAANEYEQNTNTGLLSSAEQEQAKRAATVAGNRQQTNETNQTNQFNRGLTVNDQESQRAGTVANQRVAGRNTYLQGVAGQEGQAQQGAQTTSGQQISQYGQEYGMANQANGQAQQYSMWQQSQPSVWGQVAGAALGAAAAFEDGGVAGSDGPDSLDPAGYRDLVGPTGPDAEGLGTPTGTVQSVPRSFWQKLNDGISTYRNSIPNANPGTSPGVQTNAPQTQTQQNSQGGFFGGFNQGSQAGKTIGAAAMNISGMLDDGGPADGETALVGERGPEMVMEPNNPDSAQLVTKPTVAKLGNRGKKEIVVPLKPGKNANVRPTAALDAIKSYRSRAMAHMPPKRFDDGGVAQPWMGGGGNPLVDPGQPTQMGGAQPTAPPAPQQFGGQPVGQPPRHFGGGQPMNRYRNFNGQPQQQPTGDAQLAPGGAANAAANAAYAQQLAPGGYGQTVQPVQPQQMPQQQQMQQPQQQQRQQPQMMADGGVMGPMKARYRRPMGPVGPHGPIRPLIPLKSSQVFR